MLIEVLVRPFGGKPLVFMDMVIDLIEGDLLACCVQCLQQRFGEVTVNRRAESRLLAGVVRRGRRQDEEAGIPINALTISIPQVSNRFSESIIDTSPLSGMKEPA